MSELPTIDQMQQMTDEEIAKRLMKKMMFNVLLFVVVKGAIYYGMHRWAKSMAENN